MMCDHDVEECEVGVNFCNNVFLVQINNVLAFIDFYIHNCTLLVCIKHMLDM
jgi:hypothetical protein